MLEKIINTLNNNSYTELLNIAFTVKAVKQHNLRRYNNETVSKKQQLIYFLIKKANELNPKLNLHENNYKTKLKPFLKKQTVKVVHQKIVPKDKKTSPFIETLKEINKSEKTDKQYAKWFYEQPAKIQKIYKEQGAAYRKRGKLHTEAKKIKGNSIKAIAKRKVIIDEMSELTLKIKQLYSITQHFEKTGKIIL